MENAKSNAGFYWSYDHLIIQLELFIDILKFLYTYPSPERYET